MMKHCFLFLFLIALGLACVGPARAGDCGTVCPAPVLYSRPIVTTSRFVSHTPTVVKKTVVVVEPEIRKYVAVIPLVEFPTYSAVYVPPVVPVGVPVGVPTGPIAGVAPPVAAPVAPPVAPSPPAPSAIAPGDVQRIMDALSTINRNFESFDTRIRRLEDKVNGPATPLPTPLPTPNPKPVDPFNPTAPAPAASTPPPAPPGEAPPVPPTMPKADGAALLATPSSNIGKCALCHARGNEASGKGFVLSDASGIVRLSRAHLDSLAQHVEDDTMPKMTRKAREAGILPFTPAEKAEWRREIARQRALPG